MTNEIRSFKILVEPENVPLMREWLANRGGLAHWSSINLSNLGQSWTGPALEKNGDPAKKPSSYAASEPSYIVTDPAQVAVVVRKEVERFHVAIRPGSQGFTVKLTDGSTEKLNKAMRKHGEDATYAFDYETQEAVISMPERVVPINDWTA